MGGNYTGALRLAACSRCGGRPRHKDGKPNDMTPICERFANQVEGRYGIPVVREDERYSSVEAESYHDADDDEPIDDEPPQLFLTNG